jgi:hypothetical protein
MSLPLLGLDLQTCKRSLDLVKQEIFMSLPLLGLALREANAVLNW